MKNNKSSLGLKIYPWCCQLSNRLGSAKCAADLVLPSAVARTGEQAITIEGKKTHTRLYL